MTISVSKGPTGTTVTHKGSDYNPDNHRILLNVTISTPFPYKLKEPSTFHSTGGDVIPNPGSSRNCGVRGSTCEQDYVLDVGLPTDSCDLAFISYQSNDVECTQASCPSVDKSSILHSFTADNVCPSFLTKEDGIGFGSSESFLLVTTFNSTTPKAEFQENEDSFWIVQIDSNPTILSVDFISGSICEGPIGDFESCVIAVATLSKTQLTQSFLEVQDFKFGFPMTKANGFTKSGIYSLSVTLSLNPDTRLLNTQELEWIAAFRNNTPYVTLSKSFSIEVSPVENSGSSSGTFPIWAIILIVVLLALLILAIVIITIVVIKKRRKSPKSDKIEMH